MILHDALILTPDDIDLSRSPLRRGIAEPTYVLGAFNPGMTRLPNGNLLLVVRIAEALVEPVRGDHVRSIRWTPDRYRLDEWPLDAVDLTDPRQFALRGAANRILALTSLSWLLPVEVSADGTSIVDIRYDEAIEPAAPYQEYGLEDARISRVGNRWYMTSCSVSAERHSTTLHVSDDAREWHLQGMILDHQNKDMLLFEGLVDDRFVALTRPLGECYFAPAPDSPWVGGPSINLATSPDALHWRPLPGPGIRARKGSVSAMKVGGGTPPVRTDAGWLTLYHGVERRGAVGVYRTFWALLDADDPTRVLRLADASPLIEASAALTTPIADQLYLPTPVVFSTGMVDGGDRWIVASGEGDLACRITHLDKGAFA